jgi:GNAT superfamily N-acetyltransferase
MLTALAYAAKARWGYPPAWLDRWREALTITPDYIRAHSTHLALVDETPVGFCAVRRRPPDADLDHLWVLPAAQRQGIGRALFARAETVARAAGCTRLTIVGDPHAAKFYTRLGAILIGHEPAPMDGQPRLLPLLEKAL